MPSNRIDATFAAEQIEKARTALTMLTEALPFLVDLSAEERVMMPKFGEANRSFVVKALAIAEAHPEILPPSLSLREFRSDVDLIESLYPVLHAVETLFRRIEDSYFAAGSEAYVSALLLYQYAKVHNLNTGALEETLDDLGRRFARKTRKGTETT